MPVVGVAVAVPEPWGTTLRRKRAVYGDPQARAVPPHVTLLPPTEIEDPQLPPFLEHLDGVGGRHAPFVMTLRGTGTFRPVSPVVFVQVARGIPACEQLERDVRSGPVARDLDFPYHPHVTVGHHLSDDQLDIAFDDLADFLAEFEVTAFEVYVHDGDGAWRSHRRVELRG